MKLKKFKERDNKRIGIIVFTLVCILLVSGVILYRTFAIFEVKTTQNVIKGTVQDPGNIYFAFYVDDEIQKDMPQKNGEYIFDEENSYCGVTGGDEHDSSIQLEFDKDRWSITVLGLKTSRTKCYLKFVSGAYILDKPVKAVTSGDGLYKVTHGEEVTGTLNDTGFKQTEWRYAGSSPNNYVTFNNETWRIIGLVNVMIDENTVEQRIKLVKNASIGFFSWDYKTTGVGSSISDSGSNDWTDSQLMEMLNGVYYESKDGNCYKQNNTQVPCSFKDNGLKAESHKMIEENIIWNVGGSTSNGFSAPLSYNAERGTTVYTDENLQSAREYVWGKKNTKNSDGTPNPNLYHAIALPYPSDIGYATTGGTLGREKCLEKELYSWKDFKADCHDNSWLMSILTLSSNSWLITPATPYSYSAIHTYNNGGVGFQGVISAENIFPTLYLKSNVKILNDNQDGSELNPFNLTLDTTE